MQRPGLPDLPGEQRVLLRIKSKTAVGIAEWSDYPEDAEVVLRGGSEYRVVKVSVKEAEGISTAIVDLEEVTDVR